MPVPSCESRDNLGNAIGKVCLQLYNHENHLERVIME